MNKDTIVAYEAGGNSITFAYRSAFWITQISGLSSIDVSISESQGAGQIGSTINDQSVQPRDITVNGVLLKDAALNRRSILACVRPGVMGKLTLTQGEESWYIQGAPKRTPKFSDGSGLQSFQFSLRCPYPYWRTVASVPSQIAGLTKLFRFPFHTGGRWYLSQYSNSLFTTVHNSGGAATEFDITFTAATQVTNPELYHVERQSYIKINKVMAAGEQISVSTVYGRKGVTLRLADGTEANGFKYLDIGSDLNMQLDPGNNTLRCAAENNREGLRVQILAPKGVLPGI